MDIWTMDRRTMAHGPRDYALSISGRMDSGPMHLRTYGSMDDGPMDDGPTDIWTMDYAPMDYGPKYVGFLCTYSNRRLKAENYCRFQAQPMPGAHRKGYSESYG